MSLPKTWLLLLASSVFTGIFYVFDMLPYFSFWNCSLATTFLLQPLILLLEFELEISLNCSLWIMCQFFYQMFLLTEGEKENNILWKSAKESAAGILFCFVIIKHQEVRNESEEKEKRAIGNEQKMTLRSLYFRNAIKVQNIAIIQRQQPVRSPSSFTWPISRAPCVHHCSTVTCQSNFKNKVQM